MCSVNPAIYALYFLLFCFPFSFGNRTSFSGAMGLRDSNLQLLNIFCAWCRLVSSPVMPCFVKASGFEDSLIENA